MAKYTFYSDIASPTAPIIMRSCPFQCLTHQTPAGVPVGYMKSIILQFTVILKSFLFHRAVMHCIDITQATSQQYCGDACGISMRSIVSNGSFSNSDNLTNGHFY